MRTKETDPDIIKARYYKQLERQKAYSNKNYDHISLVFPAGSKETILNACKEKGYKNPSEYVRQLLKNDGVYLTEHERQEQEEKTKRVLSEDFGTDQLFF